MEELSRAAAVQGSCSWFVASGLLLMSGIGCRGRCCRGFFWLMRAGIRRGEEAGEKLDGAQDLADATCAATGNALQL